MSLSIRPGLVSVTFRALSPQEIVERAAACGLEAIEWGGDVHVRNPQEALAAKRLTEDAGLRVAAYGSYWRSEGQFGRIAETAAALDAPTIRVWAGTRGSAEADREYREEIWKAIRAACELAHEVDMTISLEYHGGTLTDTLASTLRLVREIDHPALRLYWQPVPERSPTERIAEVRAVLPWLSNLHVFQWTKEEDQILRRPLEKGMTEWREVFEAAQGDRFALLEFVPQDDPSLLSREASTLRRILVDRS